MWIVALSTDIQSNDDSLWWLGWCFTGETEQGENQRDKVTYSTCSIRKIGSDHLLPHLDSLYLKMTHLDDLRTKLACCNTRFYIKGESKEQKVAKPEYSCL